MTAIAATAARASAVQAVAGAAARTGVDFSYLLTQARLESGLDPAAAASTSSARGLFQFTAGTWLETVRRHGADHGLGWAAAAIDSGLARAGSAMRATILNLREEPQAAALMAGELARDNGARLAATLGRAAAPAELYLAHFLGAEGASRFLGALAETPDSSAAALLPTAAAANRGVFYDGGRPRSLAEVFDRFAARFGAGETGNAPLASGSALPVLASDNSRRVAARAAYLLLAELGG